MAKHHGIHRYRTLFLSDLHLGTRGCQAHLILDMLRHVEVFGDFADGSECRVGLLRPAWSRLELNALAHVGRLVPVGSELPPMPPAGTVALSMVLAPVSPSLIRDFNS